MFTVQDRQHVLIDRTDFIKSDIRNKLGAVLMYGNVEFIKASQNQFGFHQIGSWLSVKIAIFFPLRFL